MLFSKEEINNKRQIEFDYIKAFAIIFMIIIHVYENLTVFENDSICNNVIENIIQFCGGPLAAPVFMISMGLGMVFTSKQKPSDFIKRGLILFGLGYLLNFVRDTIPLTIYRLCNNIDVYDNYIFVGYTFNVDILMFAGLAFILTGLLKLTKLKEWYYPIIALLMQTVALIVYHYFKLHGALLACLLGLIYYPSNGSAFPLMIWYIYPCIGMVIGKLIKHIKDLDKFYLISLISGILGLILLVIGLIIFKFDIRNLYSIYNNSYYKQNILSVLLSLFVIMISLGIVHFTFVKINLKGLNNVIIYLSKNLIFIYFAQWILIEWTFYWLVYYFMYYFEIVYSIPLGLLYLIIASLIVFIIQKIIKRIKIKKEVQTNE